jgi:DNA-binding NarL/FixJ family response regulator
VAVAADGRAAVKEVVLHRPDVAVLDLQMPGLDGFGATREISRAAPDVAVLVLTMYDDDESVFAAMWAGARGYVIKGAEQEELGRGASCGSRRDPGSALGHRPPAPEVKRPCRD